MILKDVAYSTTQSVSTRLRRAGGDPKNARTFSILDNTLRQADADGTCGLVQSDPVHAIHAWAGSLPNENPQPSHFRAKFGNYESLDFVKNKTELS